MLVPYDKSEVEVMSVSKINTTQSLKEAFQSPAVI